MKSDNFFAELKRRNVYKVALAYAVVAWLLLQAASILFPTFEAPPWVMKVFVAVVVLGFPLALVFAWAFELTPEGIKRTEDVAPNESIARRTGRKLTGIMAAITFVALGLFLFQTFRSRPATVAPVSNAATSKANAKSIAVLPFVNMSSDRENEYFVDGLTEEILNRVAQINDLRVPGRTSCFAFKDKNSDLRQVGATLGVSNVLEGSVRKSGDKLRITAQLVRTLDGYHLWSETFDRKLDDVFAIQEEIARAIAQALSAQLKVGGASHAEQPTHNMRAYDNYLEARTLINQRSPTNLRRSIPLLEAAVQLDPTFAKAWGALAQAYDFGVSYLDVETTESLQKAENAARKALALDGSLAIAHSALAGVLRDRYQWLEAEAEYQRALELSPGEAEIHSQYAAMLLNVGHTDSALEEAARACELDPLAWVPAGRRALVHLCRRELAAAKEWIDRSTKIRGHVGGFQIELTLLCALASKDADLARRAIAQTSQVEWSRSPNIKLLAVTDEALNAFTTHARPVPDLAKAFTEAPQTGAPDPAFLAAVASYIGQEQAALDVFSEHSLSRPVLSDLAFVWAPVFKPLRNEAGFLNLVRKLKLPEYWRAAGWSDYCGPKGPDDFQCTQ